MVCPFPTRLAWLPATCPRSHKDRPPARGVFFLPLGLAQSFPLSCCSKNTGDLVCPCFSVTRSLWPRAWHVGMPRAHHVSPTCPCPPLLGLLSEDPLLPLKPVSPWVGGGGVLNPCPSWDGGRLASGVEAAFSHGGPSASCAAPTGAPGTDPPGREPGAGAWHHRRGAPSGRQGHQGHLRGRCLPTLGETALLPS